MNDQPPQALIARLLVIFFAIGLHEYAHCKVADMAGDPTPRIYGRVTLNLFKHFDPMGTLMIVITSITGFGIGWGRPAPMDSRKMANPRWDFFAAVAAGPLSNVLQAIIYAVCFRVMISSGSLQVVGEGHATLRDLIDQSFPAAFCFFGVLINLSLCFFNLIPLGPLDGHWLLGLLLPEKQRYIWYRWNATIGTVAMLAIVIGSQLFTQGNGPLQYLIGTPTIALFKMLTGLDVHTP